MKRWSLQDAKNKFSEVVNSAINEGPQSVSRHGEEVVIVLSVKDFNKITEKNKGSFKKFLRELPLKDDESIERIPFNVRGKK